MQLAALNTLDAAAAAGELLQCCGSTRWARAMAGARPFASVEAAADRSDAIWSSLDRADWLALRRACCVSRGHVARAASRAAQIDVIRPACYLNAGCSRSKA